MTMSDTLSARDARLVAMLARGYTTDRAAHALGLSRHTVGEVISMLLARYDCSNRAALVAYCYVHRLLPLGIWPPPCTAAAAPSGMADRIPRYAVQANDPASADAAGQTRDSRQVS